MYKWIRCQSRAAHTPRGPSRRAQMHPAGSPASAPPSSVVGLKPARQPQCEYSYDHSYAHSLDPARYRPSLPLHSKKRPSTLQSRSTQGGLQPTVTGPGVHRELARSRRVIDRERSHKPPFPPAAETWPRTLVCRSCAASRRSGPDRPAFAGEHPRHPVLPSAGTGHRSSSDCRVARGCMLCTASLPRQGAAAPQRVEHAIEKAPVMACRRRPPALLRRQQRPDQFPFRIRQIPATHDWPSKSRLESQPSKFANSFCQHGLVIKNYIK